MECYRTTVDALEGLQSEIQAVYDALSVIVENMKMVPYSSITQEQYIQSVNALVGVLLTRGTIQKHFEIAIQQG